ncbi:MAG: class I SAM-dependent methyltransferase [Anaerolineales bacterium]|nr:class I SAM-dependent methyltransferase [Anaerolineales bacterium]
MQEFDRFFAAQYASYSLDLDFWRRHALRQGSPVLELGCGAGRVLLPLAQAGLDITGLDQDPAMLYRLQSLLPKELTERVSLVEANIEDFSLPQQYTFIFSPCNTFSYLPLSAAELALHNICQHLLPDGLLVLDLPNPGFLFDIPIDPSEPVDSFFEPQRGLPVQVYADQKVSPGNSQVDVLWHYDELQPDGLVKRYDYPITYYMRLPDRLEPMLQQAGFSDIRFAGGYNGQEFSRCSHRLVVFARRLS